LAQTKYPSPQMAEWIESELPPEFVWIEETFANRDVRPSGNLRARGETITRIANYFDGAPIATRTLQPAVVYATLRDSGAGTDLYIGTDGVGADMSDLARLVATVLDKRTLLVIGDER